jgi:ABC-type antimicrobial peptide transport system permease subunit
MTVIAIASIIVGLNRNITQEIESFGTNTIFFSRIGSGIRFSGLTKEERLRKYLTYEDAMAIKESCPSVKDVAPSLFPFVFDRDDQISFARYKSAEVTGIDFRGTVSQFISVYSNAVLKEGRFFTEAEDQHRAAVAVIGEDIATTFFPHEDPLGKEIIVNDHTFRVIGVFERAKGFGPGNEDRRVAIPRLTFHKVYPEAKEYGIRVEARPGRVPQAIDEARDVLRRRRKVAFNKPDDFAYITSEQIIEQFHQIVGAIALSMVVLSSIGLLVGGIGVMNIMLVSVTERTREIGVRKAIGARRRDVIQQFLIEAMTMTGVGGVIGIIFGWLISILIRALVPSLPTSVPLWAFVAGFLVSVSVGLFFGMWPAVKAARLDPVVALRYE